MNVNHRNTIRPVAGLVDIGVDTEVRRFFRQQYMMCLEKAGFYVEMIPQMEKNAETLMAEWVRRCDGIVLPGGGDIDPLFWGEEKKPWSGEVNHVRDYMEPILLKEAYCQYKPVLGICRGIQVMNVFSGGSLWQDLTKEHVADSADHDCSASKDRAVHDVFLEEGSCLAQIFGKYRIGVNSMHHQAIRKVAPGYRVTAICADGVIEGIERTDRPFFVGVQWHPEHMALHSGEQFRIFQAFADACNARS